MPPVLILCLFLFYADFNFTPILILYQNIKFYQTHSERFFGKRTLISVPLPSWLSKVTVPPW